NSLEQVAQKITDEQFLLNSLQNDVLNIDQFNKLFREINSAGRVPKWLKEFDTLLHYDSAAERKKYLSFVLLNKILFRILKSESVRNTNGKIFDVLLLWKSLFEIYGLLRYDDPAKDYGLRRLLYDDNFSFTDKKGLLKN